MMITQVSSSITLSASATKRPDADSVSSSLSSQKNQASDKPVTPHSISGAPESGASESSTAASGAESVNQVQGSAAVTNESTEADLQIEAEIKALAERDREVRTHEQIHASIGGKHASSPSYSYERGPDGQQYAVEGEVRIDTSPVADDPQATLEKAEVIMRAALSVAEPSTADRQVAADARAMAAEARAEILRIESNEQGSEAAKEPDDEAVSEVEQEKAQQDEDMADALNEAQQQQNEVQTSVAEQFQAFNERLNDINMAMRRMNSVLVETGAFSKLFPEGSVIDKSV